MEPPMSREPLPWICATAIAAELLTMNHLMAALSVVLMFTMHLAREVRLRGVAGRGRQPHGAVRGRLPRRVWPVRLGLYRHTVIGGCAS